MHNTLGHDRKATLQLSSELLGVPETVSACPVLIQWSHLASALERPRELSKGLGVQNNPVHDVAALREDSEGVRFGAGLSDCWAAGYSVVGTASTPDAGGAQHDGKTHRAFFLRRTSTHCPCTASCCTVAGASMYEVAA